jgi:hypothetical protein
MAITICAGDNGHLAQTPDLFAQVELVQYHTVALEIEPPAQGVGQAAPLLVYFLLHKVTIGALFGGDGIPVNGLDLHGQGLAVQVGHLDTVGGDRGHLPVFEKGQAPRVAQDGRDVTGNIHLAFAVANGHPASVAQAGRDQAIRLVLAEHDNRAGTLYVLKRATHGGDQAPP